MFYTIYKITNKINNKYYIGKHQTNDINDGYMGSGKLIKRAIEKYGVGNFIKEIMFVFDNETEMNIKEKELVILSKNSYNLCEGGKGGFGYINSNPDKFLTEKRLNSLKKGSIYKRTKQEQEEWFKKVRDSRNHTYFEKVRTGLKKHYQTNSGHFKNKSHSEETKQKLRKTKGNGEKNSQFGTCWITNDQENKKIKIEDLLFWVEKGFRKGRII